MKIIAHRGNLNGPSELENKPSYIKNALNEGFDCEVDVWFNGNGWFLGHDQPQYEIRHKFLAENQESLWIHCKNLGALSELKGSIFNYFWHQRDSFTLTSKGYIWTYPNMMVRENSVIVDVNGDKQYDCYGVCTDYPLKYV